MTKRVLDCANKVAGTSLKVEVDRDVELAAFNFDSLSVFAFLVELETSCGIEFDDALLNHEQLRTVGSTVDLIQARCRQNQTGLT